MSTSLELVYFLAVDVADSISYQLSIYGIFWWKRVAHICSVYYMNAVGWVFVLLLNIASYSCMHLYMADF